MWILYIHGDLTSHTWIALFSLIFRETKQYRHPEKPSSYLSSPLWRAPSPLCQDALWPVSPDGPAGYLSEIVPLELSWSGPSAASQLATMHSRQGWEVTSFKGLALGIRIMSMSHFFLSVGLSPVMPCNIRTVQYKWLQSFFLAAIILLIKTLISIIYLSGTSGTIDCTLLEQHSSQGWGTNPLYMICGNLYDTENL